VKDFITVPSVMSDLKRKTRQNTINIVPLKPKKKTKLDTPIPVHCHTHHKGSRHWCKYMGCKNSSSMRDPHLKFIRVPCTPRRNVTDYKATEAVQNYYKRIAYRNEFLNRIGRPNDTRSDLRICNRHSPEMITLSYEWTLQNGQVQTDQVEVSVPTQYQPSSPNEN
jgi:hypothetical protein